MEDEEVRGGEEEEHGNLLITSLAHQRLLSDAGAPAESQFERSFHGRPDQLKQMLFGKRAMNIFNQSIYPVMGMLCQTL
jgi:hypothetical protein